MNDFIEKTEITNKLDNLIDINSKLYYQAHREALLNEYITTEEELTICAKAMYEALKWAIRTQPMKNNSRLIM